MRPISMGNDMRDRCSPDAESPTQLLLGQSQRSVGPPETTDFDHLLGREFRIVIGFAWTTFCFASQPTFRHGIMDVVPLRSQKQMPTVAATWIIAFMQHVHILIRKRPVQKIRYPVSTKRLSRNSKAAVSVAFQPANPWPAIIGSSPRHIRPEPLRLRCGHKSDVQDENGIFFSVQTAARLNMSTRQSSADYRGKTAASTTTHPRVLSVLVSSSEFQNGEPSKNLPDEVSLGSCLFARIVASHAFSLTECHGQDDGRKRPARRSLFYRFSF